MLKFRNFETHQVSKLELHRTTNIQNYCFELKNLRTQQYIGNWWIASRPFIFFFHVNQYRIQFSINKYKKKDKSSNTFEFSSVNHVKHLSLYIYIVSFIYIMEQHFCKIKIRLYTVDILSDLCKAINLINLRSLFLLTILYMYKSSEHSTLRYLMLFHIQSYHNPALFSSKSSQNLVVDG